MKKIEIIKIFCAGLIIAMILFGCAKRSGTEGRISSQDVDDIKHTLIFELQRA